MRYIGGKSKIAKAIAQTILEATDSRAFYYEPFVGGGSVLGRLAPHFQKTVASDLSEDLILMWQKLQEGWVPDEVVSEFDYAALKDSEPSALRGLVGFGGSFGGKWFGGYARGGFGSDGKPRNHQWESARAAMKIRDAIEGSDVDFWAGSYISACPPAGAVVYCDPPYADTTGYSAVGGFDSAQFWRVMDYWVARGVHVFVSEYSAPEGWAVVWEKEHRQSLTTTAQGRPVTVERLFAKAENG